MPKGLVNVSSVGRISHSTPSQEKFSVLSPYTDRGHQDPVSEAPLPPHAEQQRVRRSARIAKLRKVS